MDLFHQFRAIHQFLHFSPLNQSVCECAIRENILLAFRKGTIGRTSAIIKMSLFWYTQFCISRYDEFGLFWIGRMVYPFKKIPLVDCLSALHDAFFSNQSKCCANITKWSNIIFGIGPDSSTQNLNQVLENGTASYIRTSVIHWISYCNYLFAIQIYIATLI